ncbi:DUF309 domain-containing protein [Bacillus alkalicellulosilyticus]|uniref:DUF309 domain-containing protein n=1 Tax=Alkalihalobacterium alkalicellulosilyticum TaxID=1912214 RepID=UPI000996A67A|nr:DUF309 domain-containing protein [Bacillus alkalicellulosilyticus]
MEEPSYPLEYYQFFVKFNEGDYYTCHDLLEEVWMTDKSNLFLKGLLQMSVAIYHYEYGNIKGARMMMNAAHHYLQPYRPHYWGVNVNEVNDFIETCLSIIPHDLERIPFEDVNNLPQFPSFPLYLEE